MKSYSLGDVLFVILGTSLAWLVVVFGVSNSINSSWRQALVDDPSSIAGEVSLILYQREIKKLQDE